MEKRAPFRAQQPIILLGSSGAFGEVHGGGWSGQLIHATEPSFLSGLALVRLGDAALWPCWGPFWLWRIHPRCSGVSARVLSHTCWGHEEISFLTLSLLILMGAQSVLLVSSPGFGLKKHNEVMASRWHPDPGQRLLKSFSHSQSPLPSSI